MYNVHCAQSIQPSLGIYIVCCLGNSYLNQVTSLLCDYSVVSLPKIWFFLRIWLRRIIFTAILFHWKGFVKTVIHHSKEVCWLLFEKKTLKKNISFFYNNVTNLFLPITVVVTTASRSEEVPELDEEEEYPENSRSRTARPLLLWDPLLFVLTPESPVEVEGVSNPRKGAKEASNEAEIMSSKFLCESSRNLESRWCSQGQSCEEWE